MFLRTNLKWLRKRKKRTQEDVAFALEMKRSTYSGYESGVGEPNLEKLVAIAKYFGISLDGLIKANLTAISEAEYQQLLPPDKRLRELQDGENCEAG